MSLFRTVCFCVVFLALAVLPVAAQDSSPDRSQLEFFENRIRSVLAEKCIVCHMGERPQGQLRLDSRAGWERGGKSDPLPSNPDADHPVRREAVLLSFDAAMSRVWPVFVRNRSH